MYFHIKKKYTVLYETKHRWTTALIWREKSFVMYYRYRNCYCPKYFPSLPSMQNLRPSLGQTIFQKATHSPKYKSWKAEVKIILTLNSASHLLLYHEYKIVKYNIVSKSPFGQSSPSIAGKLLEKNNLYYMYLVELSQHCCAILLKKGIQTAYFWSTSPDSASVWILKL